MNIAVFASGAGSNFHSILNYFKDHCNVRVVTLVSNNSKCGAVQIAIDNGISFFHYSKYAFSGKCSNIALKLIEYLKHKDVSMIVLAGYMKLLEPEVIRNYSNRIVNVHPALLPAFGGKGMYGDIVQKAVIDSGVKISGVTVHLVNENYDEGQIIFQKHFAVEYSDTIETLSQKVKAIEHKYYPKVIEQIALGNIHKIDDRIFLKNKIE
ncbi:MAG: phosphoribosylglycinamide formyltransferase [Ignavibacteriaceae bacterium]|nr:MAG: phosphoribosylglycinamide formyltransferase 1 [Chlorobi bacterium OLB4]MBV6399368.1 Phosphoribosylglycinamide formyltransferase [Ignavibacteria bacterium]MBW7855721.1 phosphoribosylglycinamide formyltransferase [Ignavibacteria bacterium]MCC6886879.1 phosphoribosylglycinamide formyltransferase [Ignavibacteriales bacterium]MEB2330502.1 phosphoribosylglycinamide formyltransferase [Ignavibacteriaceae bacterium]